MNGIIDPGRTICLCDGGRPDYLAATVIAPDGTAQLVLAWRDGIDDPTVRYDLEPPAHEQTGPLPAVWRARTQLAPLRCGRPTLAGNPCRHPVATPGQRCGAHRAERTNA